MKYSVIATTLLLAASNVMAMPQHGQNPPPKSLGDLPAPPVLSPSPSPSPEEPGNGDGGDGVDGIPIKKICSTACDVIPDAVKPFCSFIPEPIGQMTCKVLTDVMEGDNGGEICNMACGFGEEILNEAIKKIPEIAENGGPDLSNEVSKLLDDLKQHV